MSIKPLLRKDQTYLKWRRIRQQAEKVLAERGIDEVMELHKLRASTTGHLIEARDAASIIDASTKDQSYRSRIVSLLVKTSRTYNHLLAATDGLHNYILVQYGRQVPYTTKTDKVTYVKTLLETGYSALNRLKTTIEACDHVLTDIDKCAWALSTAVKGLEMRTKREHIV